MEVELQLVHYLNRHLCHMPLLLLAQGALFGPSKAGLDVIQHSTFNTPDEVVNILQRLSRSAQPPSSASTRRKGQREQRVPQTHSEAHRLGQTACWKAWGDRARVSFTGHALRGAPHYFRICRRADIGLRLDDHGHDTSSERSPVTTNLLTAA